MKPIGMVFLMLAIPGLLIATMHPAEAAPIGTEILAATTLNSSSQYATSDTLVISEYKRISFYTNYDETQVSESVSANLTFDISYDGTTWLDASFHDFAGGATLQTTESLSADGDYFAWLDTAWSIPFVRVAVQAINVDTDDTLSITIDAHGLK